MSNTPELSRIAARSTNRLDSIDLPVPVVDPSYRKSNRERFTYRNKATWGRRRIDSNRSNRLVNSRFVLPEVGSRDKSSCVRRVEVNVKIPHEPSSFLKRVRDSYVIPTTADMLREEIRSKRKNTT